MQKRDGKFNTKSKYTSKCWRDIKVTIAFISSLAKKIENPIVSVSTYTNRKCGWNR